MANRDRKNQSGSGKSYSLAVRIGALVLAGVLVFGTLIVTAIYMM